MPSRKAKPPAKKKRRSTKTSRSSKASSKRQSRKKSAPASAVFWPLVTLTLVMWVIYRWQFGFPVWFDETVGKAVFFGFPVVSYIFITQFREIVDSFSVNKLKQGLLQGIAFGGIFGFAAITLKTATLGSQLQVAPLFSSNQFWWEFFLALMTGFWETLFFFSFIMTVLQDRYRRWSLLQQVLLTSVLFIVFHIPNIILNFTGTFVVGYTLLLWAFAIGQAFIFARQRNAYTLVIAHAIWGMVLLVHIQ